MTIYENLLYAHQCTNIEDKPKATLQLLADLDQHPNWILPPGNHTDLPAPGIPQSIILVHPGKLKKRSIQSQNGRAALIHAIAHIEFNAINLALDAALRFPNVPREYVYDWIRVAADEARHFGWVRQRLQQLGYDYGDFPGHNGLWTIAEKTSDSPLIRMGIVPRVLEARGLDVSPAMSSALSKAGDEESATILNNILQEEIEHVAIGNRWFRYFCKQDNLHPEETFKTLLYKYCRGSVRGPFNKAARLQSGFNAVELKILEELSPEK